MMRVGGASLHVGDALEVLRSLPRESVHMCVTSPPYWGLRDYGVPGQLGLEPTVGEYVERLVVIFREVRRVVREDGVAFLNLGDSYAATTKGPGGAATSGLRRDGREEESRLRTAVLSHDHQRLASRRAQIPDGLKPKDLVGVPWRVAFALQDDGWWLRSDIIWHKPNPMPESVTDRPTKAHEYLFLLAKSQTYFFDAEAVKEPAAESVVARARYAVGGTKAPVERNDGGRAKARRISDYASGRNIRSVWVIATRPYSGAHFACMPPELAERCIKAGCPTGGTVLDPFGGAATTSLVANRLGRRSIYIDLSAEYRELAAARLRDEAPLFADAA